ASSRFSGTKRSEVKLGGDLQDSGIAGCAQFAKVGTQHIRASCWTQICRGRQAGKVRKNGGAGFSRSVGNVRSEIVGGKLRMVKYVECLQAQLQIASPAFSEMDVFENRKVLVANPRIAQVLPRIGPDLADAWNDKR